jgi:hypothetical protein
LLIASIILNYYFFIRIKEDSAKEDKLAQIQNQIATANQALQLKLLDYEFVWSIIKDPA